MKLAASALLATAGLLAGSAHADMNVNITHSGASSEYKSVLEALETSYGKNACKTHVNVFHWRTTVECVRPGGTATLVSRGITSWDRKPKSLQVCEMGAMNKQTCKDVTFTGNEEQDLIKAEQLLKGAMRARHQRRGLLASENAPKPNVASSSSMSSNPEWNLIVKGLEAAYGHQCTRHEIALPPGPSTYILDCTRPGGTATLAGQASMTNPGNIVPEYLKVCLLGAREQLHCREVEFDAAAGLESFLAQAKQMLLQR